MSYRKPVIAFDVGGISDWLEDGANGFLVERNNINELAEKMKFLYFNKEKAIQMGEDAEIKFKNLFTQDKHTKNLLEIFKGLIQ
jgi:glycosyltransferase involved in cell wall biosynthesis